MTFLTIIFLLLNTGALLLLPTRLAPLPLLAGCCYMTMGQSFHIGPATFTVIRVLVAVGFIRVLLRGERITGGLNGMDKLMLAWMGWLIMGSMFYPGAQSPLIFNLGQAYNIGGIYFLIRIFCQGTSDLEAITKLAAILLAPIAIEMVMEQFTGRNMFAVFGAVAEEVQQRHERFRAQGPFAHSILAGSVGAACLPLMIGIWKTQRIYSLIGICSCILMVGASASSGPLASMAFGIGAVLLWKRRQYVKLLKWLAVIGYFALYLVMTRPPYYIITKLDLIGGSTGWHRAKLIEAAISHLGEWWLAGTNYTRHWMPTGVSWSPNHADITNYYILMGTWSGLPLVILFLAMIWFAFRYVGRVVAKHENFPQIQPFMAWCVGAAIFSHVLTCISVAYFDQSFIFMFLSLAVASSMYSVTRSEVADREEETYAENVESLPHHSRLSNS